MTIRLLRDLVLVKLAPPAAQSYSGLHLAEALPPAQSYGKVMQIGPRVTAVNVGDVVAFAPSVGDDMDGYFATPHLMVPESQLDVVVQTRKEVSA